MEERILKTKDGIALYYYVWKPQISAKAMVELVHGMAEHPKRYDEFARFLNQHGYLVYAPAHRGHGMTGAKMGQLGYFASHNGWQLVLNDLKEVQAVMQDENPGLPCFFFGHSMGSFLTRCYIQTNSEEIAGAVLCGTAPLAGFLERLMYILIRVIKVIKGKKAISVFLNQASSKVQLAKIKQPLTAFDWLSRDPSEVKKYMDDPFCGFDCSTQFFADLFEGWLQFSNHKANLNIRPDLPLFFISGASDPVGKYGVGVQGSADDYRKLGLKTVDLKLYPDARHEILNEDIRFDVMNTILKWFESILANKG